jgi:phage shock protein E
MNIKLHNQAKLLVKLTLISVLAGTATCHGSDTNYIIIDVRSKEEWENGHLKDAKHLPLGILEDQIKSLAPNLQNTIYLYCRSGNRSGKALQIMNRLGYQHTKNLGSLNEASYFLRKAIQK